MRMPIRRRVHGFTLIELLVVVSIIALLVAILLPSLRRARQQAKASVCLSNMRGMEIAHWMYMSENDGHLIQAGLAHGGLDANEEVAWINTLQKHYGNTLLARSPADDSPHWKPDDGSVGLPVPGSGGKQYRRTSYGINNFLDDALVPWGGPYTKIERIRRPSAVIHFLYMAETGTFAGADHPHVELWASHPFPPARAAEHLELNVHGGPPNDWGSISNYGYLDGHAESLPFRKVFTDGQHNNFDPIVAQ